MDEQQARVGRLLAHLWSIMGEHTWRPRSRRSQLIREVRQRWNSNAAQWTSIPRNSSLLFQIVAKGECESRFIDDATWRDLDFDQVFQRLDRTTTDVGRQWLYLRLRTQVQSDKEAVPRGQALEEYFAAHPSERERLLVHLESMRPISASSATRLLFGGFQKFRFPSLVGVTWFSLNLVFLQLALVSGGLFWLILVCAAAVNFLVCQRFEWQLESLSDGYYVCHRLAVLAVRIASDKRLGKVLSIVDCDFSSEIASWRQLRRVLWLTSFSQSSPNLMISNFVYIVNLLTGFEVALHPALAGKIESGRDSLREAYRLIGALDAAVAVARYKSNFSTLCEPAFLKTRCIDLVDVYHPLFESPVANSLNLHGRSVLVTGSNMAGKTSFLRAVGVTIVLARSLGFCHASKAILPDFRLMTSIRKDDSISGNKSFYFAELERMLGILRRAAAGPLVVLVDEMFRGTNTVERMAGAASVLEALDETSVVFATTHDVAIRELLGAKYEYHYFSETGSLDRPFDYKIRAGVNAKRNALQLMAHIGFDDCVIERARGYAEALAQAPWEA